MELVELIAEESAFDQPCRFGNRVEAHAVYCHNPKSGLNKCRHTWYYGREAKGVQDEDCPFFEPNPNYVELIK